MNETKDYQFGINGLVLEVAIVKLKKARIWKRD